MLIRYLLFATGAALWGMGVVVLAWDVWQWLSGSRQEPGAPPPWLRLRWRSAGGWFAGGLLCFVGGQALAFVPSGHAAVRVSQFRGTRPGTLYPGAHLVVP